VVPQLPVNWIRNSVAAMASFFLFSFRTFPSSARGIWVEAVLVAMVFKSWVSPLTFCCPDQPEVYKVVRLKRLGQNLELRPNVRCLLYDTVV
jgi:hypothetical protein